MTMRHAMHRSKYFKPGNQQNINTGAVCFMLFVIVTVYCYVFLQYSQSDADFSMTSGIEEYHPQLTLLLSQQRSGSSWLGSIFDSDPDIFYLFEPLHTKIYQSSAIQLSTTDAQVEILHNICTCNFGDKVPSYGVLEQSTVGLRAQTMLYNVDTDYLRDQCLQAKMRVAKVVKITDIAVLEKLQTTYPGCRLDVLHLVRDPRGSIKSRMETFQRFFPGEVTTDTFTSERVGEAARVICEERAGLVEGLSKLSLARQIVTLKYEDLAEDPLSVTTKLFIQLNIPFNRHVKDYVVESSRASNADSGGYGTRKSSKAVYNKWQETMDPGHLRAATRSCRALLQTLGYSSDITT